MEFRRVLFRSQAVVLDLQPFGIGDRGDGERDILQTEESGGQIIAVVSAAAGEALHLGAAVAQPAGDPETVAEAPGHLAEAGDLGLVSIAFEPLIIFVGQRSEEHTSELQSLMRISYAVFCLKNKKS